MTELVVTLGPVEVGGAGARRLRPADDSGAGAGVGDCARSATGAKTIASRPAQIAAATERERPGVPLEFESTAKADLVVMETKVI